MNLRKPAIRILGIAGASIAFSSALVAQPGPIPLSDRESNPLSARQEGYWQVQSAKRALESGLYQVAIELSERALDSLPPNEVDSREPLRFVRIDALLGLGRTEEASQGLQALNPSEAFESAALLRRALVALADESAEEATRLLSEIDPGRLPSGDNAWLALVEGWLDLQAGEQESARTRLEAARALARGVSPALYSRIAYLSFLYELEFANQPRPLDELRVAYDELRGSETGFRLAQYLAIALDRDNQKEEAIELLNVSLSELPEDYSDLGDQIRLLQILVGGLEAGVGRAAARTLLISGSDREMQRIALQQLATEGIDRQSSVAQFFLDTLDEIIAAEPRHPLVAEALYYRSASHFRNGDFPSVEADGELLLALYPESEYKQGILALLASSAWQRNRFRTAASFLTQLKTEFGDRVDESQLNILIADCYFRAGDQASNPGDFADAADAYRLALGGDLDREEFSQALFQLVLAYLNSNQLDEAKKALDDEEVAGTANMVKVWQAEWMLIKEMRGRREFIEAYERINQFVGLDGLNLGLQMRMLWLGTKLSYEAGLYGETEVWIERLTSVLDELGESDFVTRVESDSLLTLAESRLRQNAIDEGLAILARVRSEFQGLESAERSYLVEARYLSDQDLLVESSQLLNELVDSNRDSPFAPLALYEIALNAEKRGQGEYLSQAIELLDRIANDYPESELVYYARLKQGNLARKLNEFEAAELVYESLENNYSERPDLYWAQLSLADTLIARASESPGKFEAGISRLELLMDLPNAPVELRVEAGYKIGTAWENQGEPLKAKAAFWNLYDVFVVEEMRIQNLGKKGRYWLSRSMFELAEIFERESNLDMAIEFYEKIENLSLIGSELARARIDQLRGNAPVANLP